MSPTQTSALRADDGADGANPPGEHYVLVLCVTGMTPRSTRAVQNVRKLCQKHLLGRYELQVVDIYQQPELARTEQVVAAPTLIKKLPLPLHRLIGDMSSESKVLVGLGLKSPYE